MQAPKRLSAASVIQSLIDEPQRFEFVQAVRLLVHWMARNGIPFERAFGQVLRFQNSLSLNFPASEIEALHIDGGSTEAEDCLSLAFIDNATAHVALTPGFIGLLGVNGALPLCHTERIVRTLRWESDNGVRAFLDLLSHRMVSLFYLASEKYRLEHRIDLRGDDGQLPLLMALAGVPPGTLTASGGSDAGHDATGFYAALLRTRPVSASTVSRILTNHFAVPIELEPFVESWDTIPENQRFKLGSKAAKLGYGATLGTRIKRRDLCARLHIGPLEKDDVERFLPGSSGAVALARMVSQFGLPNVKFVVRLVLKPSCVQRFVLSTKPGNARRIGWDTFLVGREGKVTRAVIDYRL